MLELELVQGNLLKKAVSPLVHMAADATVICTQDGISLQTSSPNNMVIAVVRVNSSSFNHFHCEEICIVGVGLNTLDAILGTTDDEESVTVRTYHFQRIISFTFQDIGTHETRSVDTSVVDVPDNYVSIDESEYEYDVVVGIPSEAFRHILMHFRFFGSDTVFVFITDSQVKFISVGEEIVLQKENGDCIIGGVEEDDEEDCRLRLSLYMLNSFIEASQHSPTAWMLGSYDFPAMLNCPIQQFGNIMFYFL